MLIDVLRLAIDSKLKGKNLTTSPSKGGQTNDAYFGQFSSLYVGERYAEPGHSDRKREKDEAKKIIGGAFRPSSPPKKAVGAGSLYGALNPPPDHVAETFKSLTKPAKGLRNITTSPPKMGGSGYSRISVGQEFEYVPSAYDRATQIERERNKAHKEKMKGQPFKGMSSARDVFHPEIYSEDAKVLRKKGDSASARREVKPFVQSSPGKKGFNGCFGKFPEYKADPYDELERKRRAASSMKGPIFRPAAGPKSSPIKSVAFNMIDARPSTSG